MQAVKGFIRQEDCYLTKLMHADFPRDIVPKVQFPASLAPAETSVPTLPSSITSYRSW